jgi:hypothetical protein
MTPAEWLACTDPDAMLAHLQAAMPRPAAWGARVRHRQVVLLVCACCRRQWPRLSGRGRRLIEAVECWADGRAGRDEVEAARRANRAEQAGPWWVAEAAAQAREAHPGTMLFDSARYPLWAANLSGSDEERRAQCDLLRDVFGNPIVAPRLDPSLLTWGGGLVGAIARDVYESSAFDRLPILADALEEAGCDSADLLEHLRSLGPHARGCWGLDLVLARGLPSAP